MSNDAAVLLALVLTGAAWLLLQATLSFGLLRTTSLPLWQRLLALVPPLTPVLGFIARKRVSSALWIALTLVYLVLWRMS